MFFFLCIVVKMVKIMLLDFNQTSLPVIQPNSAFFLWDWLKSIYNFNQSFLPAITAFSSYLVKMVKIVAILS